MDTIKKPALGAKPAHIVAWDRISELTKAIGRQFNEGEMNTELVKKWAREIIMQCNIIDEFSPMYDLSKNTL